MPAVDHERGSRDSTPETPTRRILDPRVVTRADSHVERTRCIPVDVVNLVQGYEMLR